MKTTIDFYEFRECFRRADRDNYTREGLEMLFEYLEDYEKQTGTELEFDVIAICCDYSEDTWQDIAANYSIDLTDCEDEDEKIEAVREYLEDQGVLVGESSEDSFVYRNC